MLSDEHENKIMQEWDVADHLGVCEDCVRIDVTHEHRVAKAVKRIANLTKTVATGSAVVFNPIQCNDGRRMLGCNRQGEELIRALGSGLDEIEELLAGNEFNAYFQLLRDSRQQFPLWELARPTAESVPDHLVDRACQELNGMVSWLRAQRASPSFLATLDAQRRKCDDNMRSGTMLFDATIAKHANLLPIRLDLVPGAEGPERRGICASVGPAQARAMLGKFMKHVREQYPYHGNIVKLENGTLTGLHFHVVMLLDGDFVRRGVVIGKQLGEYWRNEVTGGVGRYHNCNADSYRYPALGRIHRGDLLKRKAFVERVIGYLAKSDFWIRFSGVKKTFTRSPMPRVR